MRAAGLTLVLLLTAGLSLATYLEPQAPSLAGHQTQSFSLLETLMGDSRRLFATHFLLKADAYFHSGFYPSIFDQAQPLRESHLAEESASPDETQSTSGEHTDSHRADESDHSFLGEPRDWIDRFSRHFFPSVHTHLDEGGASAAASKPGEPTKDTRSDVGEILPWLKLSAELDPNRA